ncbi:putative MFS family arabinose efflux permease [Spinactinospora alkalitolerans]|uniref:Putative MFS family arabinose efflux permease n=1 Tax=Spinactinospora alkalitolerans TaxID=687207 RepID=A0A852TZ28_9ACTN|nr:MFS transporter [Spinactinospora alkalitolerans]NYE48043.1 putative MFS family arabinose efflux permease [Spinactinospora alkalitolerans]
MRRANAPAIEVRSEDPNARGRTALIVSFSALAASVLLVAPAVATQLQLQLGLSPTQTGDLFAVELGATSIASLPALYWIRKANLRMAALAFGLVFTVGSVVSAFVAGFETLVLVRAVTSFAGGSLMVLTMSLAAQARNRDRVFGWWAVGQIALGAVGLAVLPPLFGAFGVGAFYLFMAVLMALSLPLIRFLPMRPLTRSMEDGPMGDAQNPNIAKVVAALVACLLFYVALISVWTFMGGFAEAAGIAPETSSRILSTATIIGVVGSFGATMVGGSINRRISLLGGYCAMALSITLLFGVDNALRFGAAAAILKFAWPWTLPFLMSTLADLDPLGRATNLANLAIGGGLALGPLMAGRVVEATGGFGALVIIGIPVVVVSLLLILVAQPKKRKLIAAEEPGEMVFPTGASSD